MTNFEYAAIFFGAFVAVLGLAMFLNSLGEPGHDDDSEW